MHACGFIMQSQGWVNDSPVMTSFLSGSFPSSGATLHLSSLIPAYV